MLHTIGLIPGIITSMFDWSRIAADISADRFSHHYGCPSDVYGLHSDSVLPSLPIHQGCRRCRQNHGRQASRDSRWSGTRAEPVFDMC